MKIAVLGWYGHDNAGDERIKFCVQSFLASIAGVTSVEFFDLHAEAVKGKTDKFDCFDLVLLGGGGIILSQCNYHDFVNGIKTKIATVGVSVERPNLTANTRKFAQALLNKSMVVLVRDQESKNKLSIFDKDKKLRLSPDLTFLEPFAIVPPPQENVLGINLLHKPVHMHYSALSTPKIMWVLGLLDKLKLTRFIKTVDYGEFISNLKSSFALRPVPLYSSQQYVGGQVYLKNDVDCLKRYFPQVPGNFDDRDMDKCKLFISMRLHGAIFAVQKGIPIVSLSYLPKNRNFMQLVGLEKYVVESLQNHDILKAVENARRDYSAIREKMIAYRNTEMLKARKDLTEVLHMAGLN